MSYSVVRLDNMAGTTNGTKLVSLKFYNGTAYAAIENGSIVTLDSLIDREVWKAVAPTADQTLGKLVLVATPELWYDTYNNKNLDDFTNAAGVAARGYILCSGDEFGVTASAFAGGTAPTGTNKYITIAAAVKGLTAGAVSTNARAEYITTESVDGFTYYVLRVL